MGQDHKRHLMIKTQKNTLETPDIAQIPDPVREGELGAQDEVGNHAIWERVHCFGVCDVATIFF